MKNQEQLGEVEKAAYFLREITETIRINLEILEVLKLQGRILATDRSFIRITEIEAKTRKSLTDFVLVKLPELIESEPGTASSILRKSYQDWAGEIFTTLSFLDRMLKDYLNQVPDPEKSIESQK